MKYNKWTLGLAAVGVVSLASVAQAEEQMTALQSALSSTTISGYIDTSLHWNPGTGNSAVGPAFAQGSHKSDGFNLNVVQLTIAKPLDEAEWASGYRADLWFGSDANSLASQSILANGASDLAIRQAYLALRTPIGNGIDWKFGVFDTIIGYESLEAGNNPNYTRSYGHLIEPTTHTGILGTYRINDVISVSAGMANTMGPVINERAHGPHAQAGYPGTSATYPSTSYKAESYKTYMASVALTAPENWGWAAGSTLYGGVINGFNTTVGDNQTSWYLGGTLATPVAGLKVGAAFDYLDTHNFPGSQDEIWVAGLYGSYQATEKLSVHLRGEYLKGELPGDNLKLMEMTATLQYDLWKNVISRLEVRWDHCLEGPQGGRVFGGSTVGSTGGRSVEEVEEGPIFPTGSSESHDNPFETEEGSTAVGDILGLTGVPGDSAKENAFLIALNLIYKF